MIITSENKGNFLNYYFNFHLPQLGASLLLLLVIWARTSTTVLERSGKGRHPCSVPDLKETPLVFIVEYDVNVDIYTWLLLC